MPRDIPFRRKKPSLPAGEKLSSKIPEEIIRRTLNRELGFTNDCAEGRMWVTRELVLSPSRVDQKEES